MITDNIYVFCPNIFLCMFLQLRAQNQVLKKAVVDEQANSVALKVKQHVKHKTEIEAKANSATMH